jgi:hypothetical protein
MRSEQTRILLKTAKSKCFTGIAKWNCGSHNEIKKGRTKSVGVQPCHSCMF